AQTANDPLASTPRLPSPHRLVASQPHRPGACRRAGPFVLIADPSPGPDPMRARLLVALAVVASPSPLTAQSVSLQGHGRVTGVVVDSASGRAIVRTRVCREVEVKPQVKGMRCASPDSTGRYVLDSLPEGKQEITVTCSAEGPATPTASGR